MSEIPPSWALAQIGWLCQLVNGRAFKPSDWTSEGLPIIRIQNLNNPSAPFNYYKGDFDKRFAVKNGDLLFAWSGTPGTSFGAHIWQGEDAILNQHIFNISFDEALVNKEFFRLAINQKLEELIEIAHGGVGLRHVTKGMFEKTEIALPPVVEQCRIVAKLDSLIARSSHVREELDHVPMLIEHYKNAILEKAFTGELTAKHRQSLGSTPTKFLDVPAGWRIANLEELITEGPSNGWSPPSNPQATGALTLKLTATTSGYLRLDSNATKRIADIPPIDSKLWLRPGDLLIQRGNTIEYVGTAAIYDGPEKTYIYPDLMMRVRIEDSRLTSYVWRFINSRRAKTYFRAMATGTAGNMPKINATTVRRLKIPIPPAKELELINNKIESSFAWVDKILAEHRRIDDLLPKLDRAILARAFRGALVSQNPADEPAKVLLARTLGVTA